MANRKFTATLPAFPVIDGVRFAHLLGRTGYAASDDGRIWTCKERFGRGYTTWRPMYLQLNTRGYKMVDLYEQGQRSMTLVHRLLLEAFVGPCPEGYEACHYPDPDPLNISLDNLQWGTPQQNVRHKMELGNVPKGESHHWAKLTKDDILRIYAMRRDGMTHQAIADLMSLNRRHVGCILSGTRWAHVFHHHAKEFGL